MSESTAAGATVPEKPSLDGLEPGWIERWETEGTYRFERGRPRADTYAIDTPPPTVSGSLHVGHVFSFTHTDTVARYQRMRGRNVFYPMGWDDNGLPTERRVQNFYGVRCDPSLPYDPDFRPPEKPGKEQVPVSRPGFIELCEELTAVDEAAFEALFRRLGLSVDWSFLYETIGERARRASQRSFARSLARGDVYQLEAPTLWDVDFRTAVAQAEIEDREQLGAYHRVPFARADGAGAVEIETTRPELLPACVALVAHPDDERYQPLFGTDVVTPLFGVRVPVVAHALADPEKGTGIAMVCTFGDTTDVTWWRELGLPVRAIVGRDGRLVPVTWGDPGWESDDPAAAQARYDELAGRSAKQAQKVVVEQLVAAGALIGEPKPITHPVKFYERGDRPLEIVTSRQWFVRTMALREALIERGRQIAWHPAYMRGRYESWVEGLNGDWCISRQRFFGVPFPVWYPVKPDGTVDHAHPIVADEASLPVDPSTDVPPGYEQSQRGEPGGFIGDPDVMDTWATSSLTPQIAAGWEDDPALFAQVFPMDLRPQGHDIIRTWLFSTVVRSHFEHDSLPWTNAALSGWILDPDRKKMSKSKGNVVTPIALLEQYGSDAIRYWAARGGPGVDTAFDEGQIKVGRRLAIKVLNVSKFVLGAGGQLPPGDGAATITEPLDRALLAALADVVDVCTKAFDDYDYTRALDRAERFFWSFCDDHVELVKHRAYGGHGDAAAASAQHALGVALATLQRLLAPFIPFVTAEVWSWWQEGSVHRQAWPSGGELRAAAADADVALCAVAAEVLGAVRKAKTDSKASMRADVARATVVDTLERLALLRAVARDVCDAGRIADLDLVEGPELSVTVELDDAAS
jgi:valyl-tRNA synthetase